MYVIQHVTYLNIYSARYGKISGNISCILDATIIQISLCQDLPTSIFKTKHTHSKHE